MDEPGTPPGAPTNRNEKMKETKPVIATKSSMEILSELFSTFDAQPPVIVKKEVDSSKKYRRSKRKHKPREKKQAKTKKLKKKKTSSDDDDDGIDLSDLLIKAENEGSLSLTDTLEKIINIKTDNMNQIKKELGMEVKQETGVLTSVKEESRDVNSHSGAKPTSKAIPKGGTPPLVQNKSVNSSALTEHKSRKRKKHKSEKCVEEKPVKKIKRGRSESRSRRRSPSIGRRKELPNSRRRSADKSKKGERGENHRIGRDGRNSRKSHERDRSRSPRNKDRYSRSEKTGRSRNDHRVNKEDSNELKRRSKEESRHTNDVKKHGSRENNSHNDRNEDRRFRDRYNERERTRASELQSVSSIDKKKLLEIARRNAIQMVKSGSLPSTLTLGPQAPEKVMAAIRCGGKTVEELTDFCKTLSNQEELGEVSNVSSESESDGELKLHHPFLIKEKPLIMNIKNSVPLPTKTNQERASELRLQFPVSSGQQHRRTEHEWVPVSPKKAEVPIKPQVPQQAQQAVTAVIPEAPAKPVNELQTVPAATNAPPGPQVFPVPKPAAESEQNLAAIVSQRLAAVQRLQANPNDPEARKTMHNAQKDMNVWAESKQPIGQFTGSTGARVLSPAELAGGLQAWARKDQLQTAAPLSGGMGMNMLRKMGWRPGEGLGKEKTGALEPLLLEVKLDKKGIVAREEGKKKAPPPRVTKQAVMTLQGKHPVSLLGEYASKKKLGVPEYLLDFECGPDHMKNFLFKVNLNGIEYKPNVASGNKKEAKAVAATICLQALGLLP